MLKFKLVTAIIVGFSLILLNSNRAHALGITPPLFDYSLEPGQTIQAEAEVFNNDDQFSKYEFKVINIKYVGETSTPSFDIDETPQTDTLASWITVTPLQADMNPMTKINLSFEIAIPQDARPGTHTAVMFIIDRAQLDSNNNQVGVGKQIGLTFIVTVKGDTTQLPEFKEFELVNGISIFGIKILNTLPAKFETRLSNSGNSYYLPQGKVIVRNSSRTEIVKNIELNPNFNRVLPDSTRLYSNQFLINEESYNTYQKNQDKSFVRKAVNYLDYIVANFHIGKLNAELSVDTHVNQQEPIVYTEQINFIVFPYKAALIVILLIPVIVILRKIYKLIKQLKQKS